MLVPVSLAGYKLETSSDFASRTRPVNPVMFANVISNAGRLEALQDPMIFKDHHVLKPEKSV